VKQSSLKQDSLILSLYLVLLFGTIPFMPRLWSWAGDAIGPWHRLLPVALGTLLVLMVLRTLIKQRARWLSLRAALLVSLTILFFSAMSKLRLPVEQIHFSEYGLLSFLLFRLFRHRDPSRRVYLWTLIGACLIGFLDEMVQGLTPGRVYDTRDLWFNGVGGSLGLTAVILLFDPFFLKRAQSRRIE